MSEEKIIVLRFSGDQVKMFNNSGDKSFLVLPKGITDFPDSFERMADCLNNRTDHRNERLRLECLRSFFLGWHIQNSIYGFRDFPKDYSSITSRQNIAKLVFIHNHSIDFVADFYGVKTKTIRRWWEEFQAS